MNTLAEGIDRNASGIAILPPRPSSLQSKTYLQEFLALTNEKPSLTLVSLGSGSKGNSMAVVTSQGDGYYDLILIDAGIKPPKLENLTAMAGHGNLVAEKKAKFFANPFVRLGLTPFLDPNESRFRFIGVLVTHSHLDHREGLSRISEDYDVPIYMSEQTRKEIKEKEVKKQKASSESHGPTMIERLDTLGLLREISIEKSTRFEFENLHLGPLTIYPFSGSHDVGVLNFGICFRRVAQGVVSGDNGCITPEMETFFEHSQFIALDANHDEKKVKECDRGNGFVERVLSDRGHCSNEQVIHWLTKYKERTEEESRLNRLDLIIGMHRSATNNFPPEEVARLLRTPWQNNGGPATFVLPKDGAFISGFASGYMYRPEGSQEGDTRLSKTKLKGATTVKRSSGRKKLEDNKRDTLFEDQRLVLSTVPLAKQVEPVEMLGVGQSTIQWDKIFCFIESNQIFDVSALAPITGYYVENSGFLRISIRNREALELLLPDTSLEDLTNHLKKMWPRIRIDCCDLSVKVNSTREDRVGPVEASRLFDAVKSFVLADIPLSTVEKSQRQEAYIVSTGESYRIATVKTSGPLDEFYPATLNIEYDWQAATLAFKIKDTKAAQMVLNGSGVENIVSLCVSELFHSGEDRRKTLGQKLLESSWEDNYDALTRAATSMRSKNSIAISDNELALLSQVVTRVVAEGKPSNEFDLYIKAKLRRTRHGI